jgi:hypothetical protein
VAPSNGRLRCERGAVRGMRCSSNRDIDTRCSNYRNPIRRLCGVMANRGCHAPQKHLARSSVAVASDYCGMCMAGSLAWLPCLPRGPSHRLPRDSNYANYIRDLPPAKRVSKAELHGSNPELLMSALGQKQTLQSVITANGMVSVLDWSEMRTPLQTSRVRHSQAPHHG